MPNACATRAHPAALAPLFVQLCVQCKNIGMRRADEPGLRERKRLATRRAIQLAVLRLAVDRSPGDTRRSVARRSPGNPGEGNRPNVVGLILRQRTRHLEHSVQEP